MLKIGVAGASGRMGKEIIKVIHTRAQERGDVNLSSAVVHDKSSFLGVDAGTLAGLPALDLHLVADLASADFDVLIDFSQIASTLENIQYCVDNGKSIVIGTTGFDADQKKKIESAAQSIPVVFAPNMSVSVNLAFHLIDIAARVIGDETDIEIIEAHHKHKVDAPSGTALRMGEIAANAVGRDLAECGVFAREGHTGVRDPKEIGFSTVRAGSIIGDHTVMFADDSERLEITHKSQNRSTYAVGSVRAARWIQGQSAGLYDMQDVLGLK